MLAGWVRSRAWICLFSSTERTTGVGRRIDIEANHVFSFSANSGSFDSLNARMRCELVGNEDVLHGAQADASRLRQHPPAPVGGLPRSG